MSGLIIGNLTLSSKFILPAIAGFSDVMMRVLCYEYGAALCHTEMVSAKGLIYGGNRSEDLLLTDEREPIKAVQLFGSEPYFIEKAILDQRLKKFDLIDINMGCPVPKVVKNGDGSALMKDPGKAYDVMKAACDVADSRPVTVKMRAGFYQDNQNAVQICELAEKAGVSAVIIHARVRDQYYSGPINFDLIKEAKKQVGIPVIGNGEVKNLDDALEMFEKTRCDGIAVARAAIGKPHIFAELDEKPYDADIFNLMERHTRGLLAVLPEDIVANNMKRHLVSYLKGIKDAKKYKVMITRSSGIEEVFDILDKAKDELKQ